MSDSFNLLFVFADEMRRQAFGAGGDPQVRTPNMDRLAEEGTLFTGPDGVRPVLVISA